MSRRIQHRQQLDLFGDFRLRVPDIRGQRFGVLYVPLDDIPESRANNKAKPKLGAAAYWHCLCDCGLTILARATSLRAGITISCGAEECQIKALLAAGRPLPRHLKFLRPPIGQVFGRLTVLGLGERRNKHGRRWWIFRCTCGTVKEQIASKVMEGAILSCGCLWLEAIKVSNTKYADPLQGWRNTLLSGYKRHAVARGFAFDLSPEDFFALTRRPCAYCGRVEANRDSLRYGGKLPHNGVDRIDSSIGYTTDNCVACCKTCNIMKQRLSVSEFITHIRLILSHVER